MSRVSPSILNAQKTALLLEIARGKSVHKAADHLGIRHTTAHEWIKKPQFRTDLAAIEEGLLKGIVRQLSDAAGRALEVLIELMNNGPPNIRLGAAQSVLEIGLKYRNEYDLRRRMEKLEAQVEQQTSTPGETPPPEPSVIATHIL